MKSAHSTQTLTDYPSSHELARRALFAFIVTFIAARITVFLIMARRIPNLYFFLSDTHVHHLNYGIFLLAAVGAYTLMATPAWKNAMGASDDTHGLDENERLVLESGETLILEEAIGDAISSSSPGRAMTLP